MNALLVGTLLALAALSFVLYPLLMSDLGPRIPDAEPFRFDEPSRNEAVDALREIEFDRATGKLSDTDYDSLKASYTARAITAMRSSAGAFCERCGYRYENGAKFCSRCGRAL